MAYSIYRDFNSEYFIGSIEVELMTNHRVQLTVEGLQENYPMDYPCGQSDVRVTIIDLPVYDAIVTILDQITEDYQYRIRGQPYHDFVLCDDAFRRDHPELLSELNISTILKPYVGGAWVPFTRETLPYLKIWRDDEVHQTESDEILLLGQVASSSFTYDFPMISRDMSKEYYELTRGQRLCDVSYGQMYHDALPIDVSKYIQDQDDDQE